MKYPRRLPEEPLWERLKRLTALSERIIYGKCGSRRSEGRIAAFMDPTVLRMRLKLRKTRATPRRSLPDLKPCDRPLLARE